MEFWCSECGQECRCGDGGDNKPPKCRLHPKAAVYRRSPEGVRVRSGWGQQFDPLAAEAQR